MISADTMSKVMVSPRIGALLTQVTEVPDLETALWKVLSEYIDLKTERLRQSIQEFETKWEMTFTEFAKRCAAGTLGQDPYAYQVESDYWEWESAETLLQHYKGLQTQWISRRGGHLHPLENPTEHITIAPLSVADIATRLGEVLASLD